MLETILELRLIHLNKRNSNFSFSSQKREKKKLWNITVFVSKMLN